MRKVLFFFTVLCLAGLLLLAADVEPAAGPSVQATEPPPVTEPVLQTQPVTEETDPVQTQATEPAEQATEPAREELPFFPVEQLDRYNFELQQYVPGQTQIGTDRICLTAVMEEDACLSGKAESRAAFRYGTFSFRIRTTRKDGFFPAIWMLPTSGERYPEVDIYEAIGNEPNLVYGVIHRSEYDVDKDFFTKWIGDDRIDGSYVLTFVWTEDAMTWYMDGEEIAVIDDVPQIPMYMICNLAVGGGWAGQPDPADFPEQFEVEILEFAPEEVFSR